MHPPAILYNPPVRLCQGCLALLLLHPGLIDDLKKPRGVRAKEILLVTSEASHPACISTHPDFPSFTATLGLINPSCSARPSTPMVLLSECQWCTASHIHPSPPGALVSVGRLGLFSAETKTVTTTRQDSSDQITIMRENFSSGHAQVSIAEVSR